MRLFGSVWLRYDIIYRMRVDKTRELAEGAAAKARQMSTVPGIGTVETLRALRAMGSLIRERRAELLKDRAAYGRALVENFSSLGEVLEDAANFLLTEDGAIPPELVSEFGTLFEFWNFATFQPLADNLTYDEEEAFRAAMDKVREGWRLFLDACRMKFPDKIDELAQGEELTIECVDFVEDFFLGEIETELTDEYNVKNASLQLFLDMLKDCFE